MKFVPLAGFSKDGIDSPRQAFCLWGDRNLFQNWNIMEIRMSLHRKELCWIGDSLDVIKTFSDEARRSAGHQLGLIQAGLEPHDWKPMEGVGAGVREIRIRVEAAYRVIYVAKFSEAVYVLHAFVKKTQKTSKKDLDLSTDRYKALIRARNSR